MEHTKKLRKSKFKRFNDLVFEPHPLNEYRNDLTGIRAYIKFYDGTEISVIQGEHFYSTKSTYEVMSNRFHNKRHVQGYMTAEAITRHLIYCQRNPLMPA